MIIEAETRISMRNLGPIDFWRRKKLSCLSVASSEILAAKIVMGK